MKSEEFDELFRKEINGLEGLPPQVSWSKESGWEKLNTQLSNPARKKGIVPFWPAKKVLGSYWMYAAAAVITLMVVAVYSVKNYWAVIENQPAAEAVAIVKDADKPNSDSAQKGGGALEKSILFNGNLKEMSADNIKNGINPFLITDPGLKSQLLIYNNSLSQGNKPGQHTFPVFYASAADLQPNTSAVLPLLFRRWANAELQPQAMPVIAKDYQHNLTRTDAVKGSDKKSPMTLIIGGNLAAVDKSFNFGIESSVLFKLQDSKGKHSHMLGIGMDTRYQFHSRAESNQPLDNLNAADNDKIRNGFNTFVTASYSHNLSKKDKKAFWLGMKVGYLVQDNTNNFDDSTLMLEMIVGGNDSSKFKISPQVYLTDNLKRVMPGIKLGMTLGKFDKDVSI